MILQILFILILLIFLIIYYINTTKIQKIHEILKFRTISKYKLPTIIEKKISIDRAFSIKEKRLILKCFKHWEDLTHGLIRFDIIDNSAPSLTDKNHCIIVKSNQLCNNIYIAKVLSNDQTVIDIDNYEQGVICGYAYTGYSPNIILVVTDRLHDHKIFKQLVIHEIGHTLGLNHSHQSKSTMHKYFRKDNILTEDDIKNVICLIINNKRHKI